VITETVEDWRCGGTVPALQVRSPEFKSRSTKKIKFFIGKTSHVSIGYMLFDEKMAMKLIGLFFPDWTFSSV
jgi:hypothetical protein